MKQLSTLKIVKDVTEDANMLYGLRISGERQLAKLQTQHPGTFKHRTQALST